jgi:choline dehydrogenase-like flavoprotein
MFDDARKLSQGVLLEADVAVIGGGAGGIALALSLADGPQKVIVLESGGLTYERDTQALYKGRNVGLRYEPLDLCRVRVFGGSTDQKGWAGWCKPFDEIDFQRREWVALSGWPISKSDLAPYYRAALSFLSLPEDTEDQIGREARGFDCLPFAGSDCTTGAVALSTAPQLSRAWQGTFEAKDNIRVILHANVTRIDTNSSGRLVTSIRFETLDRRAFYVKARFVVIAAGGIETARLLLNSNEVVKPGLGNDSGWVGRCFMDHPRYAWGQITSLSSPALVRRYNPTHGVGQRRKGVPSLGASPLFGLGIELSEAAQRREKVLGSRTWILPVSRQGERASGRELRELVLWATRARIPADFLLRARLVLDDIPNAAAAVVAHLNSVFGRESRWQFVTTLEPEPNPDSAVILDESRDIFGMRTVRLNWRLTSLVEKTLKVTQESTVKELRSLGIECFVQGPGGPLANQEASQPRWVWHHMGTARMSEDPKDGVVDSNCRVHGVDNLYIVGSSVFPTCSSDMPTLTLMALACRLSDHLKTRLVDARAQRASQRLPLGQYYQDGTTDIVLA